MPVDVATLVCSALMMYRSLM